MTNDNIAKHFSLLSKLMDLHDEDAFKAKSYSVAAFQIKKMPTELSQMDRNNIAKIYGIGESIKEDVVELLDSSTLKTLNVWIDKTPKGILEIMKIKGLGPKKIRTLWKEMEIETAGELLYACNENRLVLYKGFGEKLQASIKEATSFFLNHQGQYLYAQVEALAHELLTHFQTIFSIAQVRITGKIRRQCETIEALEYVIHETNERAKKVLDTDFIFVEEKEDELIYTYNGVKIIMYTCENTFRDERLFFTTGSTAFCEAFIEQFPDIEYYGSNTDSDEIIFEKAEMQYIAPCLREDAAIIDLALDYKIPTLIEPSDIKGVIHNHSTYSDGAATLLQMAEACIEKGFAYFVISDHSQYASYAQGLKPETILKQHAEIDELNKKLSPFKIFKSIECDILPDGNLDYTPEILQTFDLVITSVHSVLKMDKERATARLVNAIENKYTNILGHLTGRLLLSRQGYPLDMECVIDACAANNVVIELNANPRRLDMDWRWIKKALDKNILISINPDAHYTTGIDDIRYGVLAAQKAGVTALQNLSSYALPDFENWIKTQQAKR